MSDNGGHYHNAALMMIIGYWPEWYGINVSRWIFLEAGEVKITIDSHHAQISHAINQYIRLGFDITVGQNIENVMVIIRYLEIPTGLSGNGQQQANFSGCIKARNISGIGEWKIFTIAKLDKCCKKDIHKPIPQVSTHTTPSSNWEMLIPNSSQNKDQLINLLETQLAEDTKKAKIAHNQINSTYNEENHHIFDVNKFPLNSGWALKANQKFGRKGTGKQISPEIRALLEGYTAQDMHDELVQHALEGEFKVEEVLKVATIQNWIGRYAREHKQEATTRKSN
ncbi:hypothetical protein C2G38_2214440 [Gigaspora rosea]|uniref:Uncharacterized protein n=1 Tax=Gigaspora rosea TaxID=44941 RepID=A0A397UF75_9GLOM|nr:hypothetical protein C2G38_2214440 [Gigaspora rosea]